MHALANWFDSWIAWAGLPLALFAWLVVVSAAIAMAVHLRRRGRRELWKPALIVGGLSALGYGADIAITLRVSPDLALEGNRMWVAVVEGWVSRLRSSTD